MKFAAISSIVTSFLLTRFYTKRKVFHGASETEASDNTIQGSIPWVSVYKRKNRVHSIFHTTQVSTPSPSPSANILYTKTRDDNSKLQHSNIVYAKLIIFLRF